MALAFGAIGCRDVEPGAGSLSAHAIEVVDDAGHTIRLAAPAQRVISLIPARTDILLSLRAADRLVARTRFDTDARLADLPSLGDALTPSVEWLAAQEPDLVIAWPDRQSRSVVLQLDELGIPVYSSRVETLSELRESVRELGALVGAERAADSLVAHLDATFDSVRRSVRGREPRTVLYLIGLDPPMAAGPGTFVDELLAIAGGANAVANASALWPMVSVEDALQKQPDVVIVSTAGVVRAQLLEQLRARPGWRDLIAVRDGRVWVVDPDLMNRPGPGLAEAAARLAELVHAS